MRRTAIAALSVVWTVLLAAGALGGGEEDAGRVPAGFRAKFETTREPYTKTGWARDIVHENTGMEFAFVPAGEFLVGELQSAEELARVYGGNASWFRAEQPAHVVRISEPFYMGKHEVTVGVFRQFTGATRYQTEVERRNARELRTDETWRDRKHAMTDRHPVTCVSWEDAAAFCEWAGKGIRLPTEAQWEYACRGGAATTYSFGNDASELGRYAWYAANSGEWTHAVGQKLPNGWGFYDMHGNVWEWCSDWYDNEYYARSDKEDPKGPSSGRSRSERGGSWGSPAVLCRSATRAEAPASKTYTREGFRVALVLEGE